MEEPQDNDQSIESLTAGIARIMVTGDGVVENSLLDLPEEKLIDLENHTVKMLDMIRSARRSPKTINLDRRGGK